jgi:hypothetical protein
VNSFKKVIIIRLIDVEHPLISKPPAANEKLVQGSSSVASFPQYYYKSTLQDLKEEK